MTIIPCLLLAIGLSLPLSLTKGTLGETTTLPFFICFLGLIACTKIISSILNTYLYNSLNFRSTRVPAAKNAIKPYIECLILYSIFSSSVLKKLVFNFHIDLLEFFNHNFLIPLLSTILVPFCTVSLLVIILSAGINFLNKKPKGIIFKELSLITTSLVFILTICLAVQNYYQYLN